MATLDIDDRNHKRPLETIQADVASASKRPHLDRSGSSYVSNALVDIKREDGSGNEGDDDSIPAYKGLEAFRKEAIFRNMREAQRDLARSDAKVRELQLHLSEADERCEALNEFWNVLVEDIQMLIREDKIAASQQHHTALNNAIAFSARQPSTSVFSRSLQERNASIKAVLSLFVSLTPASSPEVDEVQARCHRLAEESGSLRAKLARTDADRTALINELNGTIDQLRKIERMHDRLRSSTVKATERPGAAKQEQAEQAKVEAAEAERKVAVQRKEKAESEMQVDNASNGASHDGVDDDNKLSGLVEEMEEVRQLADSRLRECDDLRRTVSDLRKEAEALHAEVRNVPQERIITSDLYRELHRLYELAGTEHARIASLNDRLEKENAELREQHSSMEASATSEANQVAEELRTSMKAHEADVARLRAQRDELLAEITEKKQREALKYTQIDEIKALVRTKDMRISSLRTEIRRLQLSLAAKGGNAALLDNLRSDLDDASKQALDADVETIAVLQSRLKSAEDRSADLERQLEARASSTTEHDLVVKISALQQELDQLLAILGEIRTGDDVRTLLRSQYDDLEQTKRELATSEASTTALCDELDKLGAAYNEAQGLAGTRMADLGRLEDKVGRMTAEKNKADHKYFSAMRAKDAVENEKRVALRNVERQARALEKFADAEKVRQAQMQKYEGEVTALRRLVHEGSAKVEEMQSITKGLHDSLQKSTEAEKVASARSAARSEEYLEESRQRMAAQERAEKLQRDLDKCRKQLASAGTSRKKGGVAATTDDDQVEALNSLLRCSACNDRYRDRIITRCLHTFCHECLDARLQTRQRRCPSCGNGFSSNDVATLFFQ